MRLGASGPLVVVGLQEAPLCVFVSWLKNFNAVELMPVQEFGGEWGYNPRLLMSVHSKYGTAGQLCHLVDRCHEKGLAVSGTESSAERNTKASPCSILLVHICRGLRRELSSVSSLADC